MRVTRLGALALVVVAVIGFGGWSFAAPSTRDPSTSSSRSVVARAFEDVAVYWRGMSGEGGVKRFRRLDGGISIVGRTADRARCGDVQISPRLLRDNALYCAATDSIIWSGDGFASRLEREHGVLAVATIMAHEFGHAVQERRGDELQPLLAELQADCLAGAYVQWVVDGGSTRFSATRADVAGPLLALLDLADVPATDPRGDSAHGTGFDRVAAFLDGVEGGVARCAGYSATPPATTAQTFLNADDRDRGGDLPLGQLLTLLRADLDDHYGLLSGFLDSAWDGPVNLRVVATTPTCDEGASAPVGVDPVAVWCDSGELLVSGTRLADAAASGDFAAAASLARVWAARFVARNTGLFAPGLDAIECLTGVWLGTLHPNAHQRVTRDFVLSPGDLDEVVLGALRDPDHQELVARLTALVRGFHLGSEFCSS